MVNYNKRTPPIPPGNAPAEIVIVVGYMLLVFLRAPSILVDGRFWAEEGSLYFSKAFSSGIYDSLFSIHCGYYSLVSNCSAFLAARLVSLENAPKVTVGIAFLIQALPVILVVYGNIPFIKSVVAKATITCVILVMQPNHELWLNTITSQFYLSLATGLILVSGKTGRKMTMFKFGVLLIAGLSGMLSLFLLPFFWFKGYQEKDGESTVQALLLTACAVIECSIIVSSLSTGQRHFAMNSDILLCSLLTKTVLLPVAGIDVTNYISRKIVDVIWQDRIPVIPVALAIIFIIAASCAVLKSRKREAIVLLLAWFEMVLLSFTGAVESIDRQRISLHIVPFGAMRYYYAPNVFIFLSLFAALGDWSTVKPAAKYAAAGVIMWVLLLGGYDFAVSSNKYPDYYTGPAWVQEVALWKTDPRHALKIWPSPWTMTLTKDNNLR